LIFGFRAIYALLLETYGLLSRRGDALSPAAARGRVCFLRKTGLSGTLFPLLLQLSVL